MPTPTKGPRLGGSPAHERLILANLATQLFEHGRITTTVTKAKRLRPFAERLITKARRNDVHARRTVGQVIRDRDIIYTLFTEIGPRYAERPGGYTRITKIGSRKGDNAPLAVIELVEEETPRRAAKKSAPAKKASPAKKAASTPAAEVTGSTADAEPSDTAPAHGTPDAEGPYGPNSAAPNEDGSAPEGFTVKGNADSMKYHTTDSQWYDQTEAEVWFRSAEDAEAAGFEAPGGAAKKADDADDEDES